MNQEERMLRELDEKLEILNSQMERLKIAMTKLCDLTGASARYEEAKNTIQSKGWKYVCENYHPDINIDDPAAVPLFELYRFVYDDLKSKNEI